MKKILSVLLAVLLLACLTACGGDNTGSGGGNGDSTAGAQVPDTKPVDFPTRDLTMII